MIHIRKSYERGQADHGWLKTSHTFSFADYYDPEFMGFRVLRVINEDYIAGGRGFPPHSHRDMEILTFIIDGALEHQDSMGNREVIKPGEIQRMSAGTGVQHSEYNALKDQTTHLLQIWLLTEKNGIAPGYEQKSYLPALEKAPVALIASREGRDGSVVIHQDVDLFAARLSSGKSHDFKLREGRYGWLQMVKGEAVIGGKELHAGDGAAVADERELRIEARGNGSAEFLFFDMP